MKKKILLFTALCIVNVSSFAQFSFIHISDMHVSSIPSPDCDTNAQYFKCATKEFSNFNPRPSFVVASGDVSEVGNIQPDGMYPTITQYLFPPSLSNPGIGDYYIDSARLIPIYFTPGNHEYWTGFDSLHVAISNDTLFYYPKYIIHDTDYVLINDLAVIVFLRSGHDSPYGYPPNPAVIMGTGITDAQCDWLRNILISNSNKRKIIVMHHPPVNANGTNSDGTPFTALLLDTATNSLLNNRTNFLNLCDSNHVDVVLAGHEHQNVVANRKGDTISENYPTGTRYVQTAAAYNRSYRIITVDADFVTVSSPMRSCNSLFDIEEKDNLFNVSVFPNPARDKVTIECPQKAEIEISTIEGQIIKRLTTNDRHTTTDLSKLSPGVYIIKVKTIWGNAIRKLVIQ